MVERSRRTDVWKSLVSVEISCNRKRRSSGSIVANQRRGVVQMCPQPGIES